MSILSSIGEMWYRWGREVAIFWDHENSPAPSSQLEQAENVVKRIYDTASRHGTVKSFKAYDKAQPANTLVNLKKALGVYKGEVISCPSNGKRNVADRAISVDLLTYLLDVGDKAKSTRIILITGDGDYLRVVQTLRKKDVEVIVIVPHQCNRQLRELGWKSLVWEDVSGIAAKEYQWGREVAIFWDHENCAVPSGERYEDVVNRVYDASKIYGTVKLFKAYDHAQHEPVKTLFQKALDRHGGRVISCPNPNGKPDVVDKAIFVDIPMYLLDIGDRADSTTIVLITGDGDYLRVVEELRARGVEVIVIVPYQSNSQLRELASDSLDWEEVSSIDLDRTAQDGTLPLTTIIENLDMFRLLIAILFNHELQGRVPVSRSYVGQQFAAMVKTMPDFYTEVGCRDFRQYIKFATDRYAIITSPVGANDGEPWISLHPLTRTAMEMIKQYNRTL